MQSVQDHLAQHPFSIPSASPLQRTPQQQQQQQWTQPRSPTTTPCPSASPASERRTPRLRRMPASSPLSAMFAEDGRRTGSLRALTPRAVGPCCWKPASPALLEPDPEDAGRCAAIGIASARSIDDFPEIDTVLERRDTTPVKHAYDQPGLHVPPTPPFSPETVLRHEVLPAPPRPQSVATPPASRGNTPQPQPQPPRVTPASRKPTVYKHHCLLAGHLFPVSYRSPGYPSLPFKPWIKCQRCQKPRLAEAWQCAIKRCGLILCSACKEKIEEERVARILIVEEGGHGRGGVGATGADKDGIGGWRTGTIKVEAVLGERRRTRDEIERENALRWKEWHREEAARKAKESMERKLMERILERRVLELLAEGR